MKQVFLMAATVGLLLAGTTARATAQQVKASDALAKLGLTVTAAKDQPAEQQAADEQACVDAAVASVEKKDSVEKKKGKAGKGAAKGAGAGLLVGALTGNAVAGAAIGAGAGAGASALKTSSQNKDVEKANAEQTKQMMDQAKKSVSSCLSKKGYSVVSS